MRARIAIEVVAGIVPGTPMPEHTRRFIITSDAWYAEGEYKDKPQEAQDEIMKAYGLANEYMRSLWNPKHFNWARMDWIYF